MRILLDSNLWIAALLSTSMRNRIERILADDRLDILADAKLMTELEEVCSRSKFAHLFTAAQVADFL